MLTLWSFFADFTFDFLFSQCVPRRPTAPVKVKNVWFTKYTGRFSYNSFPFIWFLLYRVMWICNVLKLWIFIFFLPFSSLFLPCGIRYFFPDFSWKGHFRMRAMAHAELTFWAKKFWKKMLEKNCWEKNLVFGLLSLRTFRSSFFQFSAFQVFHVSGLWYFRYSFFQVFDLSGLRSLVFQIFGLSGLRSFSSSVLQVFVLWGFRSFRPSNFQVFGLSDLRVSRSSIF